MDFDIFEKQLKKAYIQAHSSFTLEECRDVFSEYFKAYQAYTGSEHPPLKTSKVIEIIDCIDGGGMFEPGDYSIMIYSYIPNLKSITVGKFARHSIAEGTHISSDNASSYRKGLAEKFFHHFKTFDPAGKELVTLHTFISNFKAFIIGTYHGAERVHLQLYHDEFCFRFNRRRYRESMFERLLNAAVGCPAVK